jgi:signal transduction histidine kinase
MSIRLRLTLWYSGVLAAILLSLGIVVYLAMSRSLIGDLKNSVREQGEAVAKQVSWTPFLTRRGIQIGLDIPPLDSFRTGMVMQVMYPNGDVYDQSSSLQNTILGTSQEALKKMQAGIPNYEDVWIAGDIPLLVYNLPIKMQDEVVAIVRVAINKQPTVASLNQLKYTLLLVGLLIVLLAASAGWFLSRKALKPIENVIAAADAIEKSADLEKRIDYEGPMDEIGRLTDTINRMLSRIQAMYSELDEAYRAQRRFVSDASHELRTPLTTIRGNVDLLEKVWKSMALEAGKGEQAESAEAGSPAGANVELTLEAMHDIASEAERMSRLVNDMLSLARADAGFTMHKEPVEMKPLVEEVARRAQFLPRSAEWVVGDLDALHGVSIYGNKDYLQQLLFILIENAFKYTDEGYVRLEARQMAGQVGLQISDTGIGMDKDEIPHIFERFYRADPSRGKKAGTGLGLSIAKWIIDQHEGSIEVKTRKDEGTTFTVWLPILHQAEAAD